MRRTILTPILSPVIPTLVVRLAMGIPTGPDAPVVFVDHTGPNRNNLGASPLLRRRRRDRQALCVCSCRSQPRSLCREAGDRPDRLPSPKKDRPRSQPPPGGIQPGRTGAPGTGDGHISPEVEHCQLRFCFRLIVPHIVSPRQFLKKLCIVPVTVVLGLIRRTIGFGKAVLGLIRCLMDSEYDWRMCRFWTMA